MNNGRFNKDKWHFEITPNEWMIGFRNSSFMFHIHFLCFVWYRIKSRRWEDSNASESESGEDQ